MSNVRAAKRRTQTGRTYGLFSHDRSSGWQRTFCILPRVTIGGKLKAGYLYRKITESYYNDMMNFGPTSIEYATEKEIFRSKLLGAK